jgi:hypothetical protein
MPIKVELVYSLAFMYVLKEKPEDGWKPKHVMFYNI